MSSNSISGFPELESLTRPLLASSPSLRSVTNSTSQVAIVSANFCPIESLDYEITENDCFKQDWRSRGRIQILQYVFMKWLLCFLIGVIVSLIGLANNLAVENLAGVKGRQSGLITSKHPDSTKTGSPLQSLLVEMQVHITVIGTFKELITNLSNPFPQDGSWNERKYCAVDGFSIDRKCGPWD